MRCLPFLLFLAACPSPPDDTCFEEGGDPVTLRVTLDADTDVGDARFDITVTDCLEGTVTASATDGETVDVVPPSTGELTLTVSGPWGALESGGEGGTCFGTATVDPEEGEVTPVTVQLVCETLD